MHTAKTLDDDSFAISIDGRSSDVFDLFPAFDEADRIGVVVSAPHGALGASLLYLAAVHVFYELQRARSEDFWIYPDFYLFHVGARFGHHGSLDVWPDHKEVEVAPEPDRILEAINDRAITRLVVPDQRSGRPPSSPEARASFSSRLRSAFAYSPAGSLTERRRRHLWERGDGAMGPRCPGPRGPDRTPRSRSRSGFGAFPHGRGDT